MDIPRAAPLPTGVTDASLGKGLAQGWEAGNKMGYISSQTTAQDIQNQYAPQAAALKAQEQAAKIKKEKIDSALNFLGTVGEKLKFFSPDSQKKAIANGMNALDDAAPEWGIGKTDPATIPDEGTDLVEQFGKLRKAHQAGDISDPDFMMEGQTLLSKMTQYQKDTMKESEGILGQPTYEPGQSGAAPGSPPAAFNTKTGQVITPRGGTPVPPGTPAFVPAGTAASTAAENVRGAASATAPLVGAAYSVNLAKHALTKGDELNDHIAINEFGKLINNGTPVPLAELKQMAASGTWGPKFAQAFSKFTGSGALSDEQRAMMQSALTTLGESLQQQTGTRTSQFPGATPPNLPSISAYKVGQTVKFDQGAYKKTKEGSDNDPSTWELVPKARK